VWNLEVKPNEAFVTYYKAQDMLKDEEEWTRMVQTMTSPLPITFRINPMCPNAERLKRELATTFQFNGREIVVDGKTIAPVRPVEWVPNRRAWQLGCPKRSLRASPLLKLFHKWIQVETGSGNITRQELVSMIPPLLLDCRSGHAVFDMCASPGSKTSQMLEDMHATAGEGEGCIRARSEGLLVANDVDTKRAYMLVHQLQRLRSPMVVTTTHEAQNMPTMRGSGKAFLFDRILCDVPCSGDGTARKNCGIFKRWDTEAGIGLHGLQLLIAMRGVELLNVGGLMVYSTCSLNPMENEAVVAELVRRCGGAIEVVDASHKTKFSLPRLADSHAIHKEEKGKKKENKGRYFLNEG
jgi:16S rRNA C967 or C1407 C5-methylase (RsmB/RsmF family)